MCNLTVTQPKHIRVYFAYLNQLRARIHWDAHESKFDSLDEELYDLTEFYLLPQTEIGRRGILDFLFQIQTYEEYQRFVKVHKELLQVWIDFDVRVVRDGCGQGPYSFFCFVHPYPIQAMEMLLCVEEVYNCFGASTHKVLEQILSLGMYVAGDFQDRSVHRYFIDFFLRRTRSLLYGHCQVLEQLRGSNLSIPWQAAENMAPTNGDLHCGGKLPYLLVLADKKVIYKPRDMRADGIITEALAYFSGLLEDKLRLPVCGTELAADHTGIMAFAVHAEEMSMPQAKSYFSKLGVLLCFAKLLGVRDLHYENIMATKQGPVMIDLECGLNPNSIKSRDLIDQALELTRKAFYFKKLQNATFFVKNAIPSLTDWAEDILYGFSRAAGCCLEHKGELSLYYRSLMERSFCFRITPVSTEDFYHNMYGIVSVCENSSRIEAGLGIICGKIIENLYKNRPAKAQGMTFEEFENCLEKDLLFQAIYNSLFYGNIPLLQMENTADEDGIVWQKGLVNGVPFFKKPIAADSLENLAKEFENQIHWLASQEAYQLVEAFVRGGKTG